MQGYLDAHKPHFPQCRPIVRLASGKRVVKLLRTGDTRHAEMAEGVREFDTPQSTVNQEGEAPSEPVYRRQKPRLSRSFALPIPGHPRIA